MAGFFVRRPIVAMVIAIIIVIVGLVALGRLPIAQYPEITPPMVSVTATYTGANAVNVEFLGLLRHARRIVGRHHDQHSGAHVEHAVHLVPLHASGALQEPEEGTRRPGATIHHRAKPVWKDAGKVARNAAPGDVSQGVDPVLLKERPEHRQVGTVDVQQPPRPRRPAAPARSSTPPSCSRSSAACC